MFLSCSAPFLSAFTKITRTCMTRKRYNHVFVIFLFVLFLLWRLPKALQLLEWTVLCLQMVHRRLPLPVLLLLHHLPQQMLLRRRPTRMHWFKLVSPIVSASERVLWRHSRRSCHETPPPSKSLQQPRKSSRMYLLMDQVDFQVAVRLLSLL